MLIQLVSGRTRIETQVFLIEAFPTNYHDIFPGFILYSVSQQGFCGLLGDIWRSSFRKYIEMKYIGKS